MSTQGMPVSNYKADEKEAARNRKKLMAIIKRPENTVCADCPAKRARHNEEIETALAPGAEKNTRRISLPSLTPRSIFFFCVLLHFHSGPECVGIHQPGHVHLLPMLGHPPQPRHAPDQGKRGFLPRAHLTAARPPTACHPHPAHAVCTTLLPSAVVPHGY